MKIGFFGCSFTEGGGLNSPVFNEYAIKNNLIPKEYEGEYEKTRKGFRYSTLIGKNLNCEVENFGKGRSSNEYIFNQLYKHHKKFDICVVQLTIYSRRYQWDEREEKFEHINDIDNFTLNRFNREYARDQVSMMVNLFDSLNKKIYWMSHEDIPKNLKSDNLIYFEPKGHLHDFVMKNKLTFKHETNGYYDDLHYSIEGNRIIADKILEKINGK
tara:strand:+ start:192 stop:833 length:642 start_codon:yes stop_codon:yes gene_type:complete